MPGGTKTNGRRVRVTAGDVIHTPPPAPVERRKAHPAAWRLAVHLVEQDGDRDRRRLRVLDDGSVLIRNNP